MKRVTLLALSLLAAGTTACYHQVVESGLAPSPTVIDMGNVNTGVWGLSGATVDVRTQCPSGVAVVATEESFVNALLSGLTLGLYTPRHVTVTCALATAILPTNATTITVASDATSAQREEGFRTAVNESLTHGGAVIVRF